jgi:hypothetical protein
MIKNFKWLFLVAATFIACESDDETTAVVEEPLTAGSANFTKFVALGNSLTAGFSDNALFIEGQKGSYTNILAQQFAKVGGGEYKIPFMADNVGGLLPTALGQFPRLVFNGVGPVSIGQSPYNQVSTTTLTPLTGGFDNMGVPGAKSFHLLSTSYGNPAGLGTFANPYFVRFASNTSASILGDALTRNHTFFSLWIGNNDVLSYATSGGTGVNQLGNLNPATYGSNDITDPNVFASVYSTLLDGTNGLTKNGAKGVVANIPYVSSIPFFTTVAYNAATLPLANATALNTAYNAYNIGIAGAPISAEEKAKRTITFVEGKNALVIIDEALSNLGPTVPKMRMATSKDLILLSSGGVSAQVHIAAGNGITSPLADNWVLTEAENLEIKTAVDAYNATIETLATSKGLAFFDAKKLMSQVATTGVSSNGYTVRSTYVTGGGFSMDGVHPSPRGYALIANAFMDAINKKYGSNLKPVDISKYRVQFPSSL